MGRKRPKTTEVQTTLSGQDTFDIDCLSHALGVDRSALLRQWIAEKLETIRRCKDIEKAEARALLKDPSFIRFSQNENT